MLIVGIDPGKYGGIVAIDKHGEIQFLEVMPQEFLDMVSIFVELVKLKRAPTMAFVEKAQVFPGQGGVGNFTYGEHFGTLQSALKTSGMPYELVPPQAWTKVMHVGCCDASSKSKQKSKQVMKKLYPGISLTNPHSTRSKNMHDGLMDALLIAEYGRRRMLKWGEK